MRRQPHIETVLDSLAELSSRDQQERLWLSSGGHGAEVSSPVEAVCSLFDDSGLGDALDWAWLQRQGGREVSDMPVYTAAIDERIRALRDVLRKLPAGSPRQVIDSSVMVEVRAAATWLLLELRRVATIG